MIDLKSGELLDLLTQPFDDLDMQCFSYALKQCAPYILEYADRIRTNAFIDGMPGYILDILAKEFNAPYYRADMDIEAKREIIKGSLKWQYHAGTRSAVEELLSAAFGGGSITEWQNYSAPPYTPGTFDISIDLPLSQVGVELFLNVIKNVKNERSHLRKVEVLRNFKAEQKAAVGICTYTHCTISALSQPQV